MCRACKHTNEHGSIAIEKWTNGVANLNAINAAYAEMNTNLHFFEHIDPNIKQFRRRAKKLIKQLNKEYQSIHKD